MFKNSYGEYCKWYYPEKGRTFRNASNYEVSTKNTKKRKLVFASIASIASASLFLISSATLKKEETIFTLNDWNRAFANDQEAIKYLTDRNNYKVVEGRSDPYQYFVSGGNIPLFQAGLKDDNKISTTDKDTLVDWLINDINKFKAAPQYNKYGEEFWVPVNHQDINKSDVWSHPTANNTTSNLYNGQSLAQYYNGADNTNVAQDKTYVSLVEAVNSLIEGVGISYTFDSQTFNTVEDIYSYFKNNKVTYEDVNRFKFTSDYTASNGSKIAMTQIHSSQNNLLTFGKNISKTYEESLIAPWNWSNVTWETTGNYTSERDTWITDNTVAGSGYLRWSSWAKNTDVASIIPSSRPTYLTGVPAQIYSGTLKMWATELHANAIWSIFEKSTKLGKFAQKNTTQAYQCNGGQVLKDTQFLTDFKTFWNDMALQELMDFDTELKPFICKDDNPIYNSKVGGGRKWATDLFFAPWFTDLMDANNSPSYVEGHTPTESEYQSSVEYTSDFNAWKSEQDKLGYVRWNNVKFNSRADALTAVDARINSVILPTITTNDIWKKATYQIAGSATQQIVKETSAEIEDIIKLDFYDSNIWTLNPGGNFILKTGLNTNANLASIITDAPATGSEEEYLNFFKYALDSKWGIPGKSLDDFHSIKSYINDVDKKVVVYKNFNDSKTDYYEWLTPTTEVFDAFLAKNYEALNFSVGTREGEEKDFIILKIDHVNHKFETIDESLEYWKEMMK